MRDRKTIAVFGDSIMYGSGNDGKGVGEYLVKELGFKLLKYCVGGARTGFQEGKDWIVRQVQGAASDGITPDYIVFDGFTNDCNMTDGKNCDVPLGEEDGGYSEDIFSVDKSASFSYCFKSILHAFKSRFPSAKILFVRPHKMGRRDEKAQILYGERAVTLCKKGGIAVADIYAETALNTFLPEHRDLYTADTYGRNRGDCTHPNALGYETFYMPLITEKLKKL